MFLSKLHSHWLSTLQRVCVCGMVVYGVVWCVCVCDKMSVSLCLCKCSRLLQDGHNLLLLLLLHIYKCSLSLIQKQKYETGLTSKTRRKHSVSITRHSHANILPSTSLTNYNWINIIFSLTIILRVIYHCFNRYFLILRKGLTSQH